MSYTRPVEQIFQYDSWTVCLNDRSWQMVIAVSAFKQNAKGLMVKLAGYDSRQAAQGLIGSYVGIDRSRLKPLPEGDYYWLDLIGLSVVNLEGVMLGKVDHLLETGANDVLVVHAQASQDATVEKSKTRVERLLPWSDNVVIRVDLEIGVITVDWAADY